MGQETLLLLLCVSMSLGGIVGYDVLYLPDGDGVFLKDRLTGTKRMIRLSGIDCPEYGQQGKDEAQTALQILLDKVDWDLIPRGTDPYGRTLASLVYGENILAAELVRVGLCFAYFPYLHKSPRREERVLLAAQREALAKRAGLLSLKLYRTLVSDCFSRPLYFDRYPRPGRFSGQDMIPLLPWDWRHWVQQQTGLTFIDAITQFKQHPELVEKLKYCTSLEYCKEKRTGFFFPSASLAFPH